MSNTTLTYIDIELDIEYEFVEGSPADATDQGTDPILSLIHI